jgi:hypothetical protein
MTKENEELIYEGRTFRIGTGTGIFKGHGGHEFVIIFPSGELTRTNDLWHTGETDEKDNVEIVSAYTYDKQNPNIIEEV